MTIYFDFDRTLFDTEKFIKDMEQIIIDENIELDLFYQCKKYCKGKGFNPFVILDNIPNISKDNDIYRKIEELIQNTYQYVFDDVKPFLEKYQGKYNYVLLSRGNSDFQLAKVKYSKLQDYFEKIIITMEDKGKLDIDYQHGIFIDDYLDELKSISKNKPYQVIMINRYLLNGKKKISKIQCVSSLNEINSL